MKIEVLKGYDELSLKAFQIIKAEAREKGDLVICAATGKSPTGTYELITKENKSDDALFSSIKVIKLDEWGGIPMDHPKTCEYYLQSHLIKPLGISSSNYISFQSNTGDPEDECKRIQHDLNQLGRIDICILGLGSNGHIALNEPGDYLQPYCHVAYLSEVTLQHPMAKEMENKPPYGLTLGMADILKSGKIILMIQGEHKQAITKELLKGRISTQLPASLLYLHQDCTFLISSEAYRE